MDNGKKSLVIIDSNAVIYIISSGKSACRLVVDLPMLDSARRLVLEDKLVETIKEDLGVEGEPNSKFSL